MKKQISNETSQCWARTNQNSKDEDYYNARPCRSDSIFLAIDVPTFHRILQQAQLQMTSEICLLHESKHAKEKTNINIYTFKSYIT